VERGAELVLSNKFLQSLMTYHLLIFIVFVLIYKYAIDFREHFKVPPKTPSSISVIAYFVLLCQTTVMTGEIVPKTNLGRSLLSTHVFFSWFVVILSITPIGEEITGIGIEY
jgi:hypothetical protein